MPLHVTPPGGPAEAAVVCRGLSKSFGDVHAVAGLDLVVNRGECFGLLGPNGAGKTTTIEILEGLLTKDAGEVTVLGTPFVSDPRLRARIGISLQDTQLNDKLTVLETLRLFRSFYPRGRAPEELLAQLSLTEKRGARVGKLSGGQRQRLSVACALVGEPELLFLDEPTTGLDPQSRRDLWDQVQAFRTGGGTVLLTTHYMEEAERLCDRVAIVDRGRVIALGTPAELVGTLHATSVVEFSCDPMLPTALLLGLPGVSECRPHGPSFLLAVRSLPETVPALLLAVEQAGAKLSALHTHRATLEDVFVALTGRDLRDG